MKVVDIICQLFPKAAPSKSAARRLIEQNAVRIDDLLVDDVNAVVVPLNVGNHRLIAVVEGRAAKSLLNGENVTVDLAKEDISESCEQVKIQVGKKNIGIITL